MRKLANFALAVWEILTDSASIFFWLFLLKEAGEAVLQEGWRGLWRSLLESSDHRAFQLYVVGSSAAILAAYWIPVTLFTILVRLRLRLVHSFLPLAVSLCHMGDFQTRKGSIIDTLMPKGNSE